jgi:protein-tyrosine-phosphatase
LNTQNSKRILIVCGGNTCRSPMAKVILEQKLAELGKMDHFEIDSAAYDAPTLLTASKGAKEAIMALYGEDILASHMPKKLTAGLARQADLILVMLDQDEEGTPRKQDAYAEGICWACRRRSRPVRR